MSEFSRSMKQLDRKNRHINNHVKCDYCGRVVFRFPCNRKKHVFCCPAHAGLFRQKHRDYSQKAFGVSSQIAFALQTGEWPV